jgi:hypothetical protein
VQRSLAPAATIAYVLLLLLLMLMLMHYSPT